MIILKYRKLVSNYVYTFTYFLRTIESYGTYIFTFTLSLFILCPFINILI